jgi:hypothetical protein
MAFDLPATPVLGDTYVQNGIAFQWNGVVWENITAIQPAPQPVVITKVGAINSTVVNVAATNTFYDIVSVNITVKSPTSLLIANSVVFMTLVAAGVGIAFYAYNYLFGDGVLLDTGGATADQDVASYYTIPAQAVLRHGKPAGSVINWTVKSAKNQALVCSVNSSGTTFLAVEEVQDV